MSSISIEYARALYELSPSDIKGKHEILESLETLISVFSGDIYKFFSHPEISKEDKKKMIDATTIKGLVRDFLFVLIDNDRLSILEEIKNDYLDLLNDFEQVIDVICYSKELLSNEYLNNLKSKLENKLNKKVNIENKIDESIIGGIKISYLSKEIDMTINSKLDSLISKLKE